MDTRTGEINSFEAFEKKMTKREREKYLFPALLSALAPKVLERLMAGKNATVDKYDPCPCGSAKKFKFCCWKR